MKVKFNESVAGVDFVYGAGEVKDLPASEAKYWIKTGYAEEYAVKETNEPKAVRPLGVEKAKVVRTRPVKKKK